MSELAAIVQLRRASIEALRTVTELGGYVTFKFGFPVLVSVGITFWSFISLLDRASQGSSRVADLMPGLGSFLLLFCQLGLVDDISDLRIDSAGSVPRIDPGIVRLRRQRLWGGLFLTAAIIVALNWNSFALIVALGALGAMIIGDLGFKSNMLASTNSKAIKIGRWFGLAIFYEGAPFLIFHYVYQTWQHSSGRSLSVVSQLTITTIFWAGFEFWKYSRHLTRPDWHSYELPWQVTRRYLVVILCLSLASQIGAWWFANLSMWFVIYAIAMCATFGALLWLLTPTSRVSRSALLGYLFIAFMNIGLLVATLQQRGIA